MNDGVLSANTSFVVTFTGPPVVQSIDMTPNAGSGVKQIFTAVFSDSAGVATDLMGARVRFRGTRGLRCVIDYNAISNQVRTHYDLGGWSRRPPSAAAS